MNQYVNDIRTLAREIGALEALLRDLESSEKHNKRYKVPLSPDAQKERDRLRSTLDEKRAEARDLLRGLWVVQP